MKKSISIPIMILAGLTVSFSVWPGDKAAPAQFIGGPTPGLVAAQAYVMPAAPIFPVRIASVSDPVLDANEALVYDLDSGDFLFQKNIDTQAPIASLTKVLSTLVVRDYFSPDDIVTVSSSSIKVDGQKQTLFAGEELYVKDLVSMMLVESSNDAAYALAAHAQGRGIDFVAEMNRKAQSLGMTGCSFTDPAGLDDKAFCTPRDLVRLVRGTLKRYSDIWRTTAQKELNVTSVDGKISHSVKSTNELLGQVEGIIGGKTGNTDGALGCLVLLVKNSDNGDTLVSVVLGSRSRFTDTKKLIDWVRSAYTWHD